ncbi:hypothetical protein OAG24_00495 [bacterium]|nr:hypothetical protein [bacterium]
MDSKNIPQQKYEKIAFVMYSSMSGNDVRRLSEKEITKPSSRGGGGTETSGTPYDEHLGVLENGKKCMTCQKSNNKCPGHYGHIELPVPMYNKTKSMITSVTKLLQCVCQNCSRPRILPDMIEIKGISGLARLPKLKAILKICEKVKVCPWDDCQAGLIFYDNLLGEIRSHVGDKSAAIPFSAERAREIFLGISDEHFTLLGFNYNLPPNPKFKKSIDGRDHVHQTRPEDFIFTALPVIPPIARPYVKKDGSEYFDDDLTEIYNSIIKLKNRYEEDENPTKKTKPKAKLTEEKKKDILKDIQNNIQKLSDKGTDQSSQSSARRPLKSITDRTEGKTGRIQANIGGKRTDFSCRNVITGGGVDLRADEFGIPQEFAKELTIPEKVTPNTIKYITELIRNGKVNKILRKHDGDQVGIMRITDDFEPQYGDVAERQLEDGDIFLINRQPTLRKESAFSVKIKIHKDPNNLSFVLPACNTTPLGADFDGDEINAHLPQSELARGEIEILYSSKNIIVTPQRSSNIVGICQDGLVSLYLMTLGKVQDREETMIEKETFMQVITQSDISMERYNNLLPRAYFYYGDYIEKTQLESGSYQYYLREKVPGKLLASILFPEDFCYTKKTFADETKPYVLIEKGIMLPESGPLCSKSIGLSANSIVHNLWKEYSPTASSDFLTDTQFIGDHWLQYHGFSVGLGDCVVKSDVKIKEILADVRSKCDLLRNNGGTEEEICNVLNSAMNLGPKIIKDSIKNGELNPFNIMKNCGAKGGPVNILQISAFAGQQNVKGERIPNTLSNNTRTLPYFEPNEDSIESRGFVEKTFFEGLDPVSFFLHCIAGREGLISTSVKTAGTGYVQRRLGEKLKNYVARYDGAIEDVSGQIIQFLYRGDGMDPQKIYKVEGLDYPFFANPMNISRRLNANAEIKGTTLDSLPRQLEAQEINLLLSCIKCGNSETPVTVQANKNIRSMLKPKLEEVELYESKIGEFFCEIRNAFELSKIQNGEPTGLISALSIGEISTQLTLNVFHGAGTKGNKVTLGIPRFNELIDVAKEPKFPTCTVYFNDPIFKENADLAKVKSERLEELRKFEGSQEFEKIELQADIQDIKNQTLLSIEKITNKIQEIRLSSLIKKHEFLYIEKFEESGEKIPIRNRVSPIWDFVECEEYVEEWWANTYRKYCDDPPPVPEDWIVMLTFNIEKLYQADIDLDFIAKQIEDNHQHKLRCIPSPLSIGKIEIHTDFEEISEYLEKSIIFPSKEKSEKKHLTHQNINYFICRDVIMGKIINSPSNIISGIKGVDKPYPKEELSTGEWTVDFRGKQFLKILTTEGVDASRTICDDIWAVYNILGIEAVYTLLMTEMEKTIRSGDNIDLGHIDLLVRGMLKDGMPTIVRRDGIQREDSGPCGKIMFERSIYNLSLATFSNETDPYDPRRCNKKSIPMGVMFGLDSEIGTGTVKIINSDKMPISPVKIPKTTKKIKVVPHK